MQSGVFSQWRLGKSARRTAGLAALLLAGARLVAAAPPAKLDSESVIYPRNAPEAGRVTARADEGFSFWGPLAVAAILAGGGFVLLKRGGWRGRPLKASSQRLAIEETRPLGNKQFLAVATYGERKLLLAVCPGKIDLLCRLDGDSPAAASSLAASDRDASAS